MQNPHSIYVAPSGDLFFTELGGTSRTIRKVTLSTGLITRLVGFVNSFIGSGDGGDASSAVLGNPRGLWSDTQGNLFVADLSSNRIRMLEASSNKMWTVAGSGCWNCLHIEVSGDGGLATLALISRPISLFGNSRGEIYVADMQNRLIRRLYSSEGTVAPSSQPSSKAH